MRTLSPPYASDIDFGDIHVWSVPLDRVPLDDADSVLASAERARAARIRHPAGRRRYRRAHVALRMVLAGYLGVPPDRPRFVRRCPEPESCGNCGGGRPVLVPGAWPELEFSLSHSGAAALVGVVRSPGTVGVDVERLRTSFDWSRLPQVGAADRVAGFRTWTALEAVGKAAGTGLRVPVSVGEPRAGGPRRARRAGDRADWYVHEVDCPDGYVGSVATHTPDAILRSFLWT
ncbi:4'-phosphopantetheinyl transferase family protein [Streptomyces sp. NPDC057363]|uniref:4'-phosphopantetheinyl transferase family protein n=1 Tax=Streptomyces sp. NPDC057363 TaxID=3346107 RepID=UPI00363CD5A2